MALLINLTQKLFPFSSTKLTPRRSRHSSCDRSEDTKDSQQVRNSSTHGPTIFPSSLSLALLVLSLTVSAAVKQDHAATCSEVEERNHVHAVVPGRVAPKAVVVGSRPVEARVAGVLDTELDVLLGPPIGLGNVPGT